MKLSLKFSVVTMSEGIKCKYKLNEQQFNIVRNNFLSKNKNEKDVVTFKTTKGKKSEEDHIDEINYYILAVKK